ncbi:GPI mannosyltransferase 4 [Anopheles ziemanni]|uniref:GPI mannosyltransferase 4 n=1 Tax=Anopheles coustani TaxID=139045 RepID=UPI0026580F97|nr:GPI mannosyltransferase 4 [Anopheles coustani]XP_058172782.1 GPI mannosyltransferase 4 [Anopheles ziemanni]
MQFKSIKPTNQSFASYFILSFLRIVLVFVPQLGYIHPDEFFQSVEVVAGDEYGLEVTRTWEFNTTFPIRSMAISYFGMKIPFSLLRFVSMYTNYYLGINLRGSYVTLVFPRLLMVALSFVNDWSLYRICRSYGLQYQFRLIILASSYVMLVYATHTFSNSIEMALCSLLLYIVSDCMIHSNTIIYQQEFLDEKYRKAQRTIEKVRFYKLKMSLPSHSLNKCVIMATLCVVGVFNRPTFILFGMPLVFHWLLRGMGTKMVSFTDFNLRVLTFFLSAIPSLVLFIVVDSIYYGYLTMAEIDWQEIGINNFVVTPVNFIRYNIVSENTAQHGVHPFYTHVFVNVPLLYNVLGVLAVLSLIFLIYRFASNDYTSLPRAQSFVGLMLSAIFFPIISLSLINHQEARFLIPITVPLVLLHAPKLQVGLTTSYPFKVSSRLKDFLYHYFLGPAVSPKYLLKLWYTTNVFLTLFYGFLHQGGVYQVAEYFSRQADVRSTNVQIHLVTSHIYSLPQCFVGMPSTETLLVNPNNGQKYRRTKQFFLYEYGSLDLEQLYRKLKLLVDVCEMRSISANQRYRLYLAIPSSLSEQLNDIFQNRTAALIKHSQVRVFYPHLSIEALPKMFGQHPCGINTDADELDDTCPIYALEDEQNPFSVGRLLKQFSSVVHQFGLILYRIEVRRIK